MLILELSPYLFEIPDDTQSNSDWVRIIQSNSDWVRIIQSRVLEAE